MLITCRQVCETASDYIEGPVSLRQRLLLRMHLLICKHCRRYLSHLRAVIGIAAQVPPADEPSEQEIDALVERLMRSP